MLGEFSLTVVVVVVALAAAVVVVIVVVTVVIVAVVLVIQRNDEFAFPVRGRDIARDRGVLSQFHCHSVHALLG